MTGTETIPRTWRDLLAIDPSLAELDVILARYRRVLTPQNQWPIYSRVKTQVARRVGWAARDAKPELQTTEAYEVAMQHVTDTLGV